MNSLIGINMKEMYQQTKQRMNLESRQIKKMMLYNYINDPIETVIFDCREKENLKNFPSIKPNSRLILILNDSENLKSENLKEISEKIKNNDNISKGLFHIINSDYNLFLNDYPYLNLKNSDIINLPLCVLNNILYIGNFINSKNKKNLSLLKFKTIISLMKEPDKELSELYGNNYRNFKHEEINHDEIEYNEIYEYINEEINNKNTPILIYCFSGQNASVAVAASFLMKYKKWSIEFCIGYMMKISPIINIPSWLFTQLQRFQEYEKQQEKIRNKI